MMWSYTFKIKFKSQIFSLGENSIYHYFTRTLWLLWCHLFFKDNLLVITVCKVKCYDHSYLYQL